MGRARDLAGGRLATPIEADVPDEEGSTGGAHRAAGGPSVGDARGSEPDADPRVRRSVAGRPREPGPASDDAARLSEGAQRVSPPPTRRRRVAGASCVRSRCALRRPASIGRLKPAGSVDDDGASSARDRGRAVARSERTGLVVRNVAKLANAPSLTTARSKGPEMRVWSPGSWRGSLIRSRAIAAPG